MDVLHTQRTHLFARHALQLARNIMCEEVGISWRQSRFEYQNMLYPFHICIFTSSEKLGYCIPELFEIGLHSALMSEDKEVLLNTIRHEIAHLLTFLEHGTVQPHGMEFQTLCKKYGWDTHVASATYTLEKHAVQEKAHTKIQKLLALSKSSNQNEALSALKKAQALMERTTGYESKSEEAWVSRRVLHAKRISQKLHTICIILRSFHVIPTFHAYSGGVYLDLFGESHVLDDAEHIAHYLNVHLEHIWNAHTTLSGSKQKKSFFVGIAEGFSAQLHISERALLLYDEALAKAYRTFKAKGRKMKQENCGDILSRKIGQKEGKHLSLPKTASPSFIPGIQWQRDIIYNIPFDF